MLLKFFIATNLLVLAIAATIENKTTSPVWLDYDEDELYETHETYTGMKGVTDESARETITERPTCKSDEWQCADLSCVREEYKCDGSLHCEDGSDETRANCKDIQRPMLALLLYCASERTYLRPGVCPDVCEAQPEYCTYAILAEQENTPPGVCVLPDFIRNGTYKITQLNGTSEFGMKDFSLIFECVVGTELVGEANPECINGTWYSDFPYCSETCKLKRKPEYTYSCTRGENIKPCGDYVAIGTEVVVQKFDKKISNSSITVPAICTEMRVFNVTKECVEKVETRQKIFGNEILNKLSEFEDQFKESEKGSYEFEERVRSYRDFEQYVDGNYTKLLLEITVCDINLDLIDSSL